MVAQRTNSDQFNEAHVLAKRIEELTKERDALAKRREDEQTILLNSHTIQLSDINTQLTLVISQTKNLPSLGERVTRLEMWKAFVAGIAAAFTMIGGSIGWVIGILVRR